MNLYESAVIVNVLYISNTCNNKLSNKKELLGELIFINNSKSYK